MPKISLTTDLNKYVCGHLMNWLVKYTTELDPSKMHICPWTPDELASNAYEQAGSLSAIVLMIPPK